MNKLLTKAAKLLLGLSLAAGVGVAVGSQSKASKVDATYSGTSPWSYTLTSTDVKTSAQASKTLNNVSWSISAATYVGYDATKGVQIGSGSKPQTSDFTMTAAISQFGSGVGIKSITVNIATASSGGIAWSLKAGGTAGTGSTGTAGATTTNTTKTATYSTAVSSGDVEIKLNSNSKSKAIYLKSISIVFESTSKTATTTSVSAAGDKTTLDVTASPADTVVLTPTISYTGGTISSSVSWVSSNTSVATVSPSSGTTTTVTAVAKGSARITASYAGDSTYNASSGYIDILVADPNEVIFNFAALATANSWTSGDAYTSITVDGVTLSTTSGGNNGKYYSSDNSWRMYNGGSLTISAPSGKYISSISSTPSHTFNIASGATSATASFSATVQFTLITVTLTNSAPQVLYTVSYNANLVDYTGAVPSSTTQASQGASITVASALTCEGYTFNGWNTQADGQGTDVTPGATNYVPTSNLTLYGKWTENQSSGDSFTFDFTSNPGDWPTDNPTSLTEYTYSLSGDNYTFALKNVKINSGYLMCTSVAVLGLPAISGYKLVKVVAHNSSSCSTSTNVGISSASDEESYISGGAKQVWSTQGSSYTYNLSDTDENTQYYLYVTNKNAQILSLKLTYEEVESKTIASSRMVTGTVSASNETNEWHLEGFKFFVTYTGESETEVTSQATFAVTPAAVPTITANGTTSVTVTGSFKTESITSNPIQATLTFVNLYSIERLYTLGASLGKSETHGAVEFDGIYMGYVAGRGVFVMNGSYGMLVFGASDNGYTAGETYLTISGTLCTYNWLYEISSGATVNVLTDNTRKSNVEAPSTYIVTGSEDATTRYVANRKTSLSGTVAGIKAGNNERNNTAGTKATAGVNNTIYVTVGGNEVMLYATSSAISGFENKIEVGKTITAEGFSIYYNSNNEAVFEVLFETLVEADSNYHAADFAKDLLKLTRTTCAANDEGNGSALTAIWTTLAGVDHWLKVEANGEESTLINGTPDSTIVVPNNDADIDEMTDANAIAAALARYDWCTAKYNLTNFMGRTLTVSFGNNLMLNPIVSGDSNTIQVIVIISLISVTAIGGFFFIRKRKVN